MNSKEVYQVQVTQHLAEWLQTAAAVEPNRVFNYERLYREKMVKRFNAWLEGRLFGYDDKR